MKEKLYQIAIDNPLTSARRKALDRYMVSKAHLTDAPVQYEWDEVGGDVLRISADPMKFEVRFHENCVEIYGVAPLWARVLLTANKRELLRQEIQTILSDTGFVKRSHS
jgi:hypothetical protein